MAKWVLYDTPRWRNPMGKDAAIRYQVELRKCGPEERKMLPDRRHVEFDKCGTEQRRVLLIAAS